MAAAHRLGHDVASGVAGSSEDDDASHDLLPYFFALRMDDTW